MRFKALILLAGVTAFAAGCQAPAVTSGCEWTRPIRPTAEDVAVISDSLVDQLLIHNETGARICGWKAAARTGP